MSLATHSNSRIGRQYQYVILMTALASADSKREHLQRRSGEGPAFSGGFFFSAEQEHLCSQVPVGPGSSPDVQQTVPQAGSSGRSS